MNTEFNMNNMVVIYVFLLMSLQWNTSVLQTKEHHNHHLTVANPMLNFTIFYNKKAKQIHLQQLRIEKNWLSCWKTEISCFLFWLLYKKIYVNVQRTAYMLQHYNYCQYFQRILIKLLTVESVHQAMSEKLEIVWMLSLLELP